MASRDPEDAGDVFPVSLFEHPKRHDRLLRVTQSIDARAQANGLLGFLDPFVRPRVVRRLDLVDRVVRLREMVPAPFVSRRVAYDAGQKLARGRLAFLGKPQIRAECIMHAIDRILTCQTFAPRQLSQPGAISAYDIGEQVESIPREYRCPCGRILQP